MTNWQGRGGTPQPPPGYRPPGQPDVAAGAPTTLRARKVIIVGSGGQLLVYSPTQAAGNLIASIAGAATTDNFLDAILSGIADYAPGSPVFAVQLSGGAVQFSKATTEAGPYANLATVGGVVMGASSGAVEISPAMYFIGQTTPATAISGGTVLWSDANDNLQRLLPSGRSATLSDSSSDSTGPHTVTAAAATAITAAWGIPAGDMQRFTKYRVEASGIGTWGSTVQNLVMGVGFGGTQVRTATISSGIFAASQKFMWNARYTMTCLTTGVGGTVWLSGLFTITALGITYTLTSGQLTVAFGSNTTATGETINTTANTDMEMFASWASTTGASTITCVENTFERLGP